MGFYTPATIVEDTKRQGVTVRPIDVNASRWDCTLEADGPRWALRMGLRYVRGLASRDRDALQKLVTVVKNPTPEQKRDYDIARRYQAAVKKLYELTVLPTLNFNSNILTGNEEVEGKIVAGTGKLLADNVSWVKFSQDISHR